MAIVQESRRDIKQKGGTRQPMGLGKWQKFVSKKCFWNCPGIQSCTEIYTTQRLNCVRFFQTVLSMYPGRGLVLVKVGKKK